MNKYYIPSPGAVVELKSISGHDYNVDFNTVLVKKVKPDNYGGILFSYNDRDNKEHWVNVCNIDMVHMHGKTGRKLNIYQLPLEQNIMCASALKCSKSSYHGSLLNIVAYCLSKVDGNITSPIDQDKLSWLFHKAWRLRPAGYFILNKKKIRKWVAKNYSKFLTDKKLLKEEQSDFRNIYAKQYWEDVERDRTNDYWG